MLNLGCWIFSIILCMVACYLAEFRRQQCSVTVRCPSLSYVSCIYICHLKSIKAKRVSLKFSSLLQIFKLASERVLSVVCRRHLRTPFSPARPRLGLSWKAWPPLEVAPLPPRAISDAWSPRVVAPSSEALPTCPGSFVVLPWARFRSYLSLSASFCVSPCAFFYPFPLGFPYW